MTQGELFQEVISRIKPSESGRETARKHRDYVLRILDNQELGIIGVRNYGSYAKHTGIRPLNDIDIIIFISPEKYPKKDPERVLQTIARNIRPSFPNNDVIPGRSITPVIEMSDQLVVQYFPISIGNSIKLYDG